MYVLLLVAILVLGIGSLYFLLRRPERQVLEVSIESFSGAQITRLGLYGGPRSLYGSFAGKTEASGTVPTPLVWKYQSGHYALILWHADWTSTIDFTDQPILDLSGEDYNNKIVLEELRYKVSGGMNFRLEWDDETADEFVWDSIDGELDGDHLKFIDGGRPGVFYKGNGGTGDLILTTTGGDNGDSLSLQIWYRVH